MYCIEDLLHLVHSDGADELRLRVGMPPVIVLDGEAETLEGPPITTEDAEFLLHNLANTRQRRELRERGVAKFVYRFRHCATFVIRVKLKDERVEIDIH